MQLARFYEGWAGPGAATSRLVQATTIPYVPYWTFGERLSVVEEESVEPLGINYSLETLAALLAHRLGQTGLLLESRDDYVAAARRIRAGDRLRADVFLSYDRVNTFAAEGMSDELARRGVSVFMDRRELSADASFEEELRSAIERSDHTLVLVGDSTRERRRQAVEIRTFLRQAASDERSRYVVPVVLEGTPPTSIPDVLRHYQFVTVNLDFDDAARQVIEMLRPTPRAPASRQLRKCFLSFYYARDLEGQPLSDSGTWESIRRKGDAAIASWIDENMRSKECLIVLVGSKTADRRWVRYATEQAWREGLGLVAIYIHNLKDHEGRQSEKGADPFAGVVVDGRAIEGRVYDPPFSNSAAVYEYIQDNIGD